MSLTLYSLPDGPPSIAVRLCLKHLGLEYNLVNVNYGAGEHMTEDYAKKNPQKEMPVLDDDGFYLSESNAILQYLADKFANDDSLYPKDLQQRALVNHRLCFNLSTYYRYITDHILGPIFFDYKRTALSLKRLHNAVNIFNEYLGKEGTKYAATNYITIADFQLVTSTMCLQIIDFDITSYPWVQKHYKTFRNEYPHLLAIAAKGIQKLTESEKNPPDLSYMNHPVHPTGKNDN